MIQMKVWFTHTLVQSEKLKLKCMEVEQFTIIKKLLEEIRDLLKEQSQPQTKITVVGNKPQSNSAPKAKGFNPNDDFNL